MNDETPSDQANEYEADFRQWAREQARLLREGGLAEIDASNIAAELEDLAGNEEAAVRSLIGAVMRGLLTWRFRPDMASPALRASIEASRRQLLEHLEENPSLREHADLHLQKNYTLAKTSVLSEEGAPLADAPDNCPYTLDQVIDTKFMPPAAPSRSIRFTERETVFTNRAALAHHIHQWQRASLDPGPMRARAGERVFLKPTDDEPTLLDEETAAAFNAKITADLAVLRDRFEELPQPLDFAGTIIAGIKTSDMPSFANMVGERFGSLCRAMGWRELAILPMVRRPILSEFTLEKRSDQRLRDAGFEADFTGAVIGPPEAFLRILGSLFWIVRLDASAPQVVFSAAGSSIVGTLCQYANIHFECYDMDERDRLETALPRNGFAIAEDGICDEPFSPNGAIPHRHLDVG